MVLNLILLLLALPVPPAGAAPEIWPPNGKLKPNNYIPPPICKYVEEVVEVAAIEEVCTTSTEEECGEEEVERTEKKTESVCEQVEEEKCEEEKCEKQVECKEVVEEKCTVEYEQKMKEECSYNTVLDKVCSRP